jgi:putative transposase
VIAARYGVHPTQVTAWKKEIADRLPELFGKKTDHDPQAAAEREEQLYKKIGQLQVQVDWAKKKLRSLGSDRRRGLIEKDHPKMPVKLQCEILGVPRATHYYRPRPASAQNLALMRAIDELHLAYPQFGSRNFVYWLNREGWRVNRKRVQRLMRKMGLEALMLKRRGLSRPHPDHPVLELQTLYSGRQYGIPPWGAQARRSRCRWISCAVQAVCSSC